LVAAEAARFHAAWFDAYESLYHPKTAELIRSGRGYSDEQMTAARAYRLGLRQRLSSLMATQGIDAWITPSAPGPAPLGLDTTGDPVMNLPWTHAGLPTLTVPSGADESGLPLGLQLVGRWQQDEELLQLGRRLETERQETERLEIGD
jgi:Asp-tRNA(Asn)/Glu-tRNA(Gln) amidotransferase A subunit family amidase